jgi:TPR repeat protein
MRSAAVVAAAATLAACASAPAGRPPAAAGASAVAPAPDEGALAARCARGFAPECRELGRARLLASPPDPRLGAALVTKACELGDAAACSDLGVLYAVGRGVAQSDERAAALVRRACEQGSALACSNEGALLAEGAAPPAAGEPREALDARIVRRFRTACDAGVPEGCANLGTALDAGRLAERDVKAAARAYRKACEAGFALACHRMAALVKERPDVAPDLTATALEVRACKAAIAPACFAASRATPPDGPRTPAARLVDAAGACALGIPGAGGYSPGELSSREVSGERRRLSDLERPPAALQEAIPPGLRAQLGMNAPAREGSGDDPPVDVLVALRRYQLGQCDEAPRAAARPATEALAVFFLDGDGRAVEVRTATAPADRALEDCAREVVSGWEFPASSGGLGGPYLARYAFEAASGPAPDHAGPGALRPALRDPACVERGVVVPAEYRESTGAVTVKLAVDATGAPGLVHALAPVPDPILAAVADAVRRCAWSPGAGEDGRPVPLWTTLVVRIEAR